jgi:predicted ArsR family transcriptional regulator
MDRGGASVTLPEPPPLPAERRERLLADLRTRGTLRVSDIARTLGVTAVTVRRDIAQLADEGVIERVHGTHVFPDTNARGEGENPAHLYSVAFPATEVWGADAAEPNASVYFDAWEPYLEPVTGGDQP